ncbi:MAG: glycosyl hydrolase [Candidatus Hydrogenedentota bacterium]
MKNGTAAFVASLLLMATTPVAVCAAESTPDYDAMRNAFANPDHAQWGEVPLWWWEGQPMTKERATAELEELAARGVQSVCPIQRSPGRCDPQSFDDDWWDMLAHVNNECQRLGMTLWAYDQVGYGHYGWLEKAAARVRDPETRRVELVTVDTQGEAVDIGLPKGELIAARAYPLDGDMAGDAGSADIGGTVAEGRLAWTPKEGSWRIAAAVAVPFQTFYLSSACADEFIDMLYGKLERVLGVESMGTSFTGIFQDEHPPTPRDIYTEELAQRFREQCGYEIGRAIPALHFDVGPRTPTYRTDFFDVYLGLVEETYWKRVYDWTEERGLLTSHDNWGRNNIYRQSEGYIDYFRSQRWFSAPGYDDAGQRPLTERNYYDAKIASSIARLYDRPRVWNEAFHSSGWGRTTDQTLTWLSAGMAFGANLYDEHGLYYATNASTWEHAAPDPHWRQPYWKYYGVLSDFVARSSYLATQGRHVVDAAVHYPVVSLLAGDPLTGKPPDYNRYMKLSQTIFDAGIDNDIIDDDAILAGHVKDGALVTADNAYRALVFGPELTVRRAVVEKVLALAQSGGTVLFYERLPLDSTEAGRDDPELAALLETMFGREAAHRPGEDFGKTHPGGGYAGFVKVRQRELPRQITAHIDRDFHAAEENLYVTHRRTDDTDIYLVMSTDDEPNAMDATFRVDGVPELWDPFTGVVNPVDAFAREGGRTRVQHRIEGNTAQFFVFREGETQSKERESEQERTLLPLADAWSFSVIPTRDNRWGEFRWPPSNEKIGPEVRNFRYREETPGGGVDAAWHTPDFDHSAWTTTLYSTGPYWLMLPVGAHDEDIALDVLQGVDDVFAGAKMGDSDWEEVAYSEQIGLAKAAPWGGHSGYPDGHIDKEFIDLPEGRKLLFTRIHAPRAMRCGLRVELRNDTPRLWVNSAEQPFEDAVGNLPLEAGENTVLLDLPDGGHGRLYVQAEPPSVATMEEAARGMVAPDIAETKWIWFGDTQATHVRKTFQLDAVPEQARIIVSAYSGFRLWVNGEKIEEEIGPWSNWKKPEQFTITEHLRQGENVIAVWGQLFAGQNVNKGPEAFNSRGIVAAVKMRHAGGNETGFTTDDSWKGSVEGVDGWELPGFDDSGWESVAVRGAMGDAPWGHEVVNNVGVVTEPKRPLSIELESPYLVCFEDGPEVTYDVKAEDAPRIGWYRFRVPPGLKALALPTKAEAQVWVNGAPADVREGRAVVDSPPRDVSTVAVRLEMQPGAYAGAAFTRPISLDLADGVIRPGLWSDYALPTYGGIGVYRQAVDLDAAALENRTWLDLGDVLVAAEVFVNGESAGVRVARPFKFELTDLLRTGENTIEMHVANTIAPHYTTIPALHLGPTESGLLGPVALYQQ